MIIYLTQFYYYFLSDFIIKLSKVTNINDYIISLEENKQIFSNLIYKLGKTKNFKDLYQDLTNKII